MAKLVTKTYADALFQLAVEENRVDEFYQEVSQLQKILEDNPDLAKVMSHPSVDKNEKLAAIRNIFTGRVSGELCGLLFQVVEKGRYEEIDGILACFIDEVKEYKKIGVATVLTPTALTDAQKKRIEQKLLDTTDYVKMEIDYKIDESLIGGMRIRIGDRVIDSSISTKINELAKSLRRIQISTV
ncbi:MAG: F0F1 ATP synthase subunit delta [Lachnospiraceae bacterium]|nr:F0F1 ATP synthase subunit delta [Lachnospiraceae bacterium]MBO4904201.1 F0F1 ATP synthase subunit delta [Lachnospiraceae bacterium]